MIWKNKVTPEVLNANGRNTMVENLGIEITEVGDDYIKGTMPVDERTVQPFGLLHGGASVSLAETLGSIAGGLCVEYPKEMVVGVEINANHMRAAKSGLVTGHCTPLRVGRKIQVWNINITNEEGKLVCTSRLTLAVVPAKE